MFWREKFDFENVSQKIRETITAKGNLAYVPLCFDEIFEFWHNNIYTKNRVVICNSDSSRIVIGSLERISLIDTQCKKQDKGIMCHFRSVALVNIDPILFPASSPSAAQQCIPSWR